MREVIVLLKPSRPLRRMMGSQWIPETRITEVSEKGEGYNIAFRAV
jgi:hypothetical protein